jgi:hypothetical protein
VELRGARRPRNLRLVPAPQLSGSSAYLTEKEVDRNAELPLSVRMRAAIELLPYSHPKLAVTAMVTENDIATLLDRRIKRYEAMNNGNLIEQKILPYSIS